MANQITIDQLKTVYKKFKELKTDTFFRTRIGTLSLEHLRPKLVDFANRVDKIIEHCDQLSDTTIKQVIQSINQITSIIISCSVQDDTIYSQNRVTTETSFNQIFEASFNWWNAAAGIISLNLSDTQRDQLIEESRKLAEELKVKSETSLKYADEIENLKSRLNEQINSLETKYKELTPKGELIAQQKFFDTEAEVNVKTSRLWLFGIILVSCVLFYVIYSIYKEFCFEMNCLDPCKLNIYNEACKDCGQTLFYFELVKAMVYRFLVVSLIIYILTFAIKNYNATRHNYTINKHKSNSFSAALALIDKVSDSGKDDLILHAAQSIFTHQVTGYIGKDTEPINPITIEKIAEKLK